MKQKTSGSGLIFAVVLLFVILGMVITLSSVTMLETKMNQKTKSSVGAFYGSESGVEWALNKIATSTGTANLSTILDVGTNVASCPAGVGTCKVYFLDSNGTVLTSSATIDQVKAVRSVGTQGDDTQRAIEAAVATSTGGGCFTYYCGGIGAEQNCVNRGGATENYCPTGFNQIYAMGHWGMCDNAPLAGFRSAYYPPGGGCTDSTLTKMPTGSAYVCCQN